MAMTVQDALKLVNIQKAERCQTSQQFCLFFWKMVDFNCINQKYN